MAWEKLFIDYPKPRSPKGKMTPGSQRAVGALSQGQLTSKSDWEGSELKFILDISGEKKEYSLSELNVDQYKHFYFSKQEDPYLKTKSLWVQIPSFFYIGDKKVKVLEAVLSKEITNKNLNSFNDLSFLFKSYQKILPSLEIPFFYLTFSNELSHIGWAIEPCFQKHWEYRVIDLDPSFLDSLNPLSQPKVFKLHIELPEKFQDVVTFELGSAYCLNSEPRNDILQAVKKIVPKNSAKMLLDIEIVEGEPNISSLESKILVQLRSNLILENKERQIWERRADNKLFRCKNPYLIQTGDLKDSEEDLYDYILKENPLELDLEEMPSKKQEFVKYLDNIIEKKDLSYVDKLDNNIKNITLRVETKKLLKDHKSGVRNLKLNRMILEDAFSHYILRLGEYIVCSYHPPTVSCDVYVDLHIFHKEDKNSMQEVRKYKDTLLAHVSAKNWVSVAGRKLPLSLVQENMERAEAGKLWELPFLRLKISSAQARGKREYHYFVADRDFFLVQQEKAGALPSKKKHLRERIHD